MTTTGSAGAPEGVAQDVEAPVAEQATVGPLTGDPAIVGVPTFGPVPECSYPLIQLITAWTL